MMRPARLARAVLASAVLATSACSTSEPGRPRIELPPTPGAVSYQLGGAFTPAQSVRIVIRDRAESPDPERYSICYVNAFQAQPGERGWWTKHHPTLLLRDAEGKLVIDREWGEPLLDLRTADRRERAARVVGRWVAGCADKGYRGVELDNLDSFTRSGGRLSADDALDFAQRLVRSGHDAGLAVGQKNAAELSPRAKRAGFDFAIAEECQAEGSGRDGECGAYTAVYGKRLLEIEYTDNDDGAFTTACARRGDAASVTLRDREVLPRGRAGYVERWCR